jgi:hypothetical protein
MPVGRADGLIPWLEAWQGSWSVQQNLQPGDTLYGDRTFTVASVPAGLAGATWIRTANGSKTVTTDPLVTFSLNVPATLSVASTRGWAAGRGWIPAGWTPACS